MFVAPFHQSILIKGNGIKGLVATEQFHLQVPLANNTLVKNFKIAIKQRFRKALPPGHGFQHLANHGQVYWHPWRTITHQHSLQVCLAQAGTGLLVKQPSKGFKLAGLNGQAGSHGMATKFENQARVAGINDRQCVSNMQAGDRAARAFHFIIGGLRKGKHGAVQLILDTGRNDANHTLVPVIIKQADTGAVTTGGKVVLQFKVQLGLGFHLVFNEPPGLVEFIQMPGAGPGILNGRRQQAFDTQRHILQTPRCIQPWTNTKGQVPGHQAAGVCTRLLQQCGDTRAAAPGTNTANAFTDQNAVVLVQHYHISNGAKGHQVKIISKVGGCSNGRVKPVKGPQGLTDGSQQIKGNTTTRQGLAGKLATRLVRIDNNIRGGQNITRQMVVCDQHLNTQGFGEGNTLKTGDAVIHGNNQVRAGVTQGLRRGVDTRRQQDNFRRQAVAVFEAVGHQVIHLQRTHGPQAQHHQGGAGGTIGIKVTDHQNALLATDTGCQ